MDHATAKHPPSNDRTRGIASNRPLTLLVHAVLLLGAGAAVFLVAGPEQGSLGVFLVCAGAVMTLCPPRVRVDWRLWAAAGGIVAGGALAFLPARWFHVPAWRTAMEATPVISLPASVSPVPWETGFWLAVVTVSAVAGLFALAHPLRTAGLVSLASVAVAVCAVYTALAIYSKQSGWQYPYAGGATFGFFPNRNHTATFLIVGSILSMGLLRIAWRDGRWTLAILVGAALALLVAALGFFSASRAGIVFLLVGTVIWAGGLGGRERSVPLLVSLGILLLTGGALFAVSGSEVRNRLLPVAGHAENGNSSQNPAGEPPPDFRVNIYEDTSRLVRDCPITGVGLGAFAMVFPQYQERSLRESNVLHPESDWLMLVAEAGLPAGLAAAMLGWLLWRHSRRWRLHPSWPLHWAYASAVAAACLHGTVDVPLHRVVLGWWVLVLAGAGLHGGWTDGVGRSRVQHALFVAGGLAALILGAGLIRAEWFGAPPLPPFAAEVARAQIDKAIQRQDYSLATKLCAQALPRAPFSERLYFQRGLLQVQAEADADSDQTFRAQRLVNPVLPSIPLSQGQLWINDDPVRTALLWREAFARTQRINRQSGLGPTADLDFYRDLVSRAKDHPVLARNFLGLAGDRHDMTLVWLQNNLPATVAEQTVRLAADEHFVDGLDEGERRRFLAVWYQSGNHAALAPWLEVHPQWQAVSWPVRLRLLVDSRRFEAAVRTAAEHYGLSLDLPFPILSSPVSAPLTELSDPAAAFTAYWHTGNEVSARRVLAEVHNDRNPPPAPEFWRLKLALAVHDANWPEAWQALTQYLNRTSQATDLTP